MERPTLNDLEAFRMVATHRSFKKAADAIGVSRSSLSHTLISLEAKLGVRLLNRTTRSVAPTDAGLLLLNKLAPVLHDLEKALDGIADVRGAPRGNLRINANKGAAQWLLRNVVPAFVARYPAVTLDLVTEGRLVDIVAQGFDAGVRLAEAVPQDMIAIPLNTHTRFVAIASPAYLAEHGSPTTPYDLTSHTCIRQRLPSGVRYRWEFSSNGKELSIDPPGAVTLDDNALMIDCAARGLGIAFVPEYLARDHLDARDLVILLDAWSPEIPGNVLYYSGYRHVPSALRAFIDIVREMSGKANR